MISITTQVTERQITGALHQAEGVIIRNEDQEYSFVPLTGFFEQGTDLGCSGVIYPLDNGQFTEEEFPAELWLRNPETTDRRVELDILSK